MSALTDSFSELVGHLGGVTEKPQNEGGFLSLTLVASDSTDSEIHFCKRFD